MFTVEVTLISALAVESSCDSAVNVKEASSVALAEKESQQTFEHLLNFHREDLKLYIYSKNNQALQESHVQN